MRVLQERKAESATSIQNGSGKVSQKEGTSRCISEMCRGVSQAKIRQREEDGGGKQSNVLG